MTGSRDDDADWGSADPSKLHELRRALERLDDAGNLERLENAVAEALRATSHAPLDRDEIWTRLERTLDASEVERSAGEPQSGPGSEPDQSEDDNTPGK